MGEEVRLREPDRKQLILEPVDYEKLVGAEHAVRAIWRVLEGLDLSRFCAPIKAREHGKVHWEAQFDAGTMGAMATAFAPLAADALAGRLNPAQWHATRR